MTSTAAHAASQSQAVQDLALAGRDYQVVYAGPDQPLVVLAPLVCTLPVWRYGQHLTALAACLGYRGQELSLDALALAMALLDQAGVAAEQQVALQPLALWWAGGASGLNTSLQGGDLPLLGGVARLRPWTEGERFNALTKSYLDQDSRFQALAYLDMMVRATVWQWQPAPGSEVQRIDDLDAASTQALLNAVTRLNVPRPEEEAMLAGGAASPVAAQLAAQSAARTLQLCRLLGWTPSQVWAAPAAEIARLELLLQQTQAPTPAPAASPAPRRRPSLADAPDAVVIRIDD